MADATRPALTTVEAAQYLQVSPRSVLRAVTSGRLAVVRVGRLVRFRQDDLDAFINDCRTPAGRESVRG